MTNRLVVKVQRNPNGRYGFSFRDEIVIEVEADCLAEPNLQVGDRILSVNGQCQRLVDYVRSSHARSIPEWTLVIERMSAYTSISSGEISFSIAPRPEVSLASKALSTPEAMVWSEPQARQLNTSLFTIKSFKKKRSVNRENVSWVLVDELENRGGVDIHRGDWILSINNYPIDISLSRQTIFGIINNLAGGIASFVSSRPSNTSHLQPVNPEQLQLQPPQPLVENPSPPVFPPLPSFRKLQSAVERLGRYRILIHDLIHQYDRNQFITEFIPQLLGISGLKADECQEFAHIVHFNLHMNFYQSGIVRVSSVSPAEDRACQYESLHQTTWNNTVDQHIHLEVLCPQHNGNLITWYSPAIYCKHSLNVILLNDPTADPHSLRKLSQVLRDILVHSGDLQGVTDYSAKVLLLISDATIARQHMIKRMINTDLEAYLEMLITNNNSPSRNQFVLMDDMNDINAVIIARDLLHSGLLLHTEIDARQMRYVHLATTVAKELRAHSDFINRGEIRSRIETLDNSYGEPVSLKTRQIDLESVLRYLHNIGLAYVPELSYAHKLRIGCPEINLSIFLHPYRSMTTIGPLSSPPSDDNINPQLRERFKNTCRAPLALLLELLNCDEAERVVALLKDLHVALPMFDSGGEELLVPCLASFDQDSVVIPFTEPDLVLKYQFPQPFILNVSLLHFIAQRADSHSVHYDSLCGKYFLHNTTIVVCLMSKVSECRNMPGHFPLAEQDKCFNFYILSDEQSRVVTAAHHIIDLVKTFHRYVKPKPSIGPLCPLRQHCNSRSPIHVLNLLKPRDIQPSCAGESVGDAVSRFLPSDSQSNLISTPSSESSMTLQRRRARESVLDASANLITPKYLTTLDKPSFCDNNWKRLAAEIGYTVEQIMQLQGMENPTECLIREASRTWRLTVSDLLNYLTTMGRIDVLNNLTQWIDEAVDADIDCY